MEPAGAGVVKGSVRSGEDTLPPTAVRTPRREAVELLHHQVRVDLVHDGSCFDGFGLRPDAQTARHAVLLEDGRAPPGRPRALRVIDISLLNWVMVPRRDRWTEHPLTAGLTFALPRPLAAY